MQAAQGPFIVSAVNPKIAALVIENHVKEVQQQIQLIKTDHDDFYRFLKNFQELIIFESQANFIYFNHPNASNIRAKLLADNIAVSGFEADSARLTIGKP